MCKKIHLWPTRLGTGVKTALPIIPKQPDLTSQNVFRIFNSPSCKAMLQDTERTNLVLLEDVLTVTTGTESSHAQLHRTYSHLKATEHL